MRFFEIVPPGTTIDFIGRWRLWVAISAAVIGVSLAAIPVRGVRLGIDFAGGTEMLLLFGEGVQTDEGAIREVLARCAIPEPNVIRYGESQSEFLVRFGALEDAGRVTAAVEPFIMASQGIPIQDQTSGAPILRVPSPQAAERSFDLLPLLVRDGDRQRIAVDLEIRDLFATFVGRISGADNPPRQFAGIGSVGAGLALNVAPFEQLLARHLVAWHGELCTVGRGPELDVLAVAEDHVQSRGFGLL